MLIDWLRSWKTARPRSKQRRPGRYRGSSLPAEVQSLEHRLMLTNYVVTTLDDVPDLGAVMPDDEISLREAIRAANTNMPVGDAPAGEAGGPEGVVDSISFDSSLSGGTFNLPEGFIFITDDLDINGLGSAELTIDAEGGSQIFDVSGSIAVSISGLTLTGGSALSETNGGAISNQLADLSLDDIRLEGNQANVISGQGGGGLFNDGGDVTITNSIIQNNTASGDGGGIYNTLGTVVVVSSEISENTAGDDGGGIYNFMEAELEVSDSIVSFNSSTSRGGGIFTGDDEATTISNTTISNNTATNGGGVSSFAGNPEILITDSTLSSNFATEDGGGIHNSSGPMSIVNSTLSGNSANDDGGGILNDGVTTIVNSTIVANQANTNVTEGGTGGGIWTTGSELAFTSIFNTIVAGNTLGGQTTIPSDIANENLESASAFNLIGDPNSAGGLTHGNNGNIVGQDGIEGRELLDLSIVLDPVLADNGGPTLTHNLIANSPALDAGSNSLAVDPGPDGIVGTEDDVPLADDQRGLSRIIDLPQIPNAAGGVDIGAVEFNRASINILPLDARQREGDAGPTEFIFLVTRSGNTSGTASVNYSVSPMTAGADDFVNNSIPSGTVVFDDGQTFEIITIAVNGDLTLEPNETFVVQLTTPSEGAEIETGSAAGEILNDENLQVFGAGSGSGIDSMPPQVLAELAETGEELGHFQRFFAYDVNFRGGVRVASADVNGDGAPDVITAAGPGGGPHVRVFDGLTAQPIASFFAYDPAFAGGVFVASVDIDGDGRADIITGADAGGGPHVRVFSGDDSSLLLEFFAYDPAFAGGVRVAAGNIDTDGTPEIITAAGPGGGPHVRVFDGAASTQAGTGVGLSGARGSFFAYAPAFTGGVTVAAGDFDGDGFDEIITGAGAGGGPHIRVFDGQGSLTVLNEFFAFDASMTAGLFVGTTDTNGDGIAEILVGTGPSRNQPSQVAIFNASGQTVEAGSVVFNPHFRSGVHVAGSLTPFPMTDVEPSSFAPLPASQEFGSDVMQFAFDETTLDVLFSL